MKIAKQYRLNFVLTGQQRSGLSIVSRALNTHTKVACHENLLHHDLAIRRLNHVACFGDDNAEWPPDKELDFSCVAMLRHGVFDLERFGASIVGFETTYDQVAHLQLYESFEEWWREGSFCLIHIDRNPVSCFVSLQQAKSGCRWKNYSNEPYDNEPIYVDKDELLVFVRAHFNTRYKIVSSCEDRLMLYYRDLIFHNDIVVRRLFEFLQIPLFGTELIMKSVYGDVPIKDRILNFSTLIKSIPRELEPLFDESELF